MRKMLVIPFAVMAAVIASCAQMKSPAAAESSSAPAENTNSSVKANSVLNSNPETASSPSQASPAVSSSEVMLPPLPGMDDGFGDSLVPAGPLPGDLRGNLRTPDMPSTLPMSVDGKIKPSDF